HDRDRQRPPYVPAQSQTRRRRTTKTSRARQPTRRLTLTDTLRLTPYALPPMDKKAQKRIELLRKKINDIQQRLAGARKQMDDPSEVEQLESELAAAKAEIEKLKAS